MEYTVDYFIEKFSAIPEDKWHIGDFEGPADSHCALGHCNMRWVIKRAKTNESEEALNLIKTLDDAWVINDGRHPDYPQPTPKQRILAALYDIKRKQEPEFNIPPMTVNELIGEKELV